MGIPVEELKENAPEPSFATKDGASPAGEKEKHRKEWFQKHGEMIAALVAGVLILIGWGLSVKTSSLIVDVLFITAFIIGGFAKAKEGITETIKDKTLNVELLMLLAAIGAAVIGYWLEGAILIFIFSLSGALETYAMNKSSDELSALMSLTPETARVLRNGKEESILAKDLQIGDTILVKPGELMPADGVVVKGKTSINESAITGESMPVRKGEKEEVLASTVNLNGVVHVKVTKTNEQTLFQKIIKLVQSAQEEKPPAHLFIERVENYYVIAVLAASGLMMFLPHFLLGWSWNETIYRALVLLVVASPCALVASTMPAILSAISKGARKGMLFKGGVHLEGLASLSAIAFDKTGTLTTGKPEVTDIVASDGWDPKQILQIAVSIEHYSNHPLASAIMRKAKDEKVDVLEAEEIKDNPGWGIEGIVSGKHYKIGKADFVGTESTETFLNTVTLKSAGKTIVFVKSEQGIIGALALKDAVRTDAKKAIEDLNAAGVKTYMLTGDSEETAREIAREVGVTNYKAECLPNQKLDEIKRLTKNYQRVAMVGDGINDTPALATAHVGIAMGAGTDAALETANVVIVNNDLRSIPYTIKLSKKMNRIIKQNMVFSIAVIVALIASNFMQNLSLPLGVIGHEGSTILVILNGLRMLRG
ncbi:heavy metal translocating P-type ATPase [Oceanobacillus kapialis]|uniref:heavy metal translocating P-type ATPase n=1 Tax=Oceanobacillus kapialis TaxID=481353 RepID=UPI00384CAB6C